MVIFTDDGGGGSGPAMRSPLRPSLRMLLLGYWPSRCNRVMYEVLTWFHADMYFSMHWVKQVCSPLDREEPGFGTHFWKQCSLIF